MTYAAIRVVLDRWRPTGVFQMGRTVHGPLHLVAGHTERFGSTLFGDTVTACGLTLPWGQITASTDPKWVRSPSRCADCFPAS